MSNEKTGQKYNKFPTNLTKCESFSQYLQNVFNYIPMKNNLLFPESKKNELIEQNNLLKYTKLDGSKSIILSNINSFPLNEHLSSNSDIVKTIKENLSFISSNTKYINNIPKLSFKPKIIISENPFLPPKNINNINNNIFQTSKNNLSLFNKQEQIIDNKENENNQKLIQ